MTKLSYIWDIYIAPLFVSDRRQRAYWKAMREKYNRF